LTGSRVVPTLLRLLPRPPPPPAPRELLREATRNTSHFTLRGG
jgi:hypothetical protein